MTSRAAAVAGLFYPQDKNELKQQIQYFLEQANTTESSNQQPLAIIVPHAGYIYSGLTAAYAYQKIIHMGDSIKRVIILGPAHRFAFNGMAVPDVSSFVTPLGKIPLDTDEINHLLEEYQLLLSNQAHDQEHCLEVQLPFLQTIIHDFKLIPIVVGQCDINSVANLCRRYINQPGNLIVISTDLSHFMEYTSAQQHDQKTSNKIMQLNYNELEYNDACGRTPLAGMLQLADQQQLSIQQLDMRNSGDTAGDKQRVVGYGAWSIYAK
ncbi:MAG: AmmeMemoRadiSam system protein B [Pseudomonadota bacterium]